MGRRGRRWLLPLALVLVALAAAAGPPRHSAAAQGVDAPLFRFVSMPDFVNADIGDTRDRAGHGWDPGDPNSISDSWRRALDVVLDQVEAEHPAFVLVAGDLVNGHWVADDPAGIFGRTATTAQRRAAVAAAGRLYYGTYRRMFSARHLVLYPAVGDHDIGDNPWPAGGRRHRAVAAHKAIWARYFTANADGGHRFAIRPVGTASEDTAYAVRVADTLVVTVDEFLYRNDGVALRPGPGELRWLDGLLAAARAAGIEHIIVQGHLPVLGPVPSYASSRLQLDGGATSPFWRLLQRYGVDLYLAGEMHVVSMLDDGVVQLVHGGFTGAGRQNYVVGDVYPDRIELTVKQFTGRVVGRDRLWQLGGSRPAAQLEFDRAPAVVATYVVR